MPQSAGSDSSGPDELLAEVLARYDESPNARLKEVMQAAIRHLHAFAREVDLQRDEWFAGIQWLTATGQMCSDTRQEFILLSPTRSGLSTLVEMLSYSGAEGTTENTVLGPFYAAGSPDRANGESMLDDDDSGDKVVVRGTDHQRRGRRRSQASCSTAGRATPTVGTRCRRPTGRASSTCAASTTPTPTASTRSARCGRASTRSPTTARSGQLLKANNRGWMRPGHLHTWVKHPGYKELITHIFDRTSDHLYDDAVFGVRESLIVDFTPDETGELVRHLRLRARSR